MKKWMIGIDHEEARTRAREAVGRMSFVLRFPMLATMKNENHSSCDRYFVDIVVSV